MAQTVNQFTFPRRATRQDRSPGDDVDVQKDAVGNRCDVCKRGQIRRSAEAIDFRQETQDGWIDVHVIVEVGRCDRCGQRHLDEAAEAAIELAFREARARSLKR